MTSLAAGTDGSAERLAVDGGHPVRTTVLPLARPLIGEEEAAAAAEAVRSGHLIGGGVIGHRVEAALERALAGTPTLFMASCTAALEASVLLSGAGHDDEIICPSFTFVSMATAVLRVGARPVFVDVDPTTLNINPDSVERAIGPRTRAIMLVHYGGRACDMERLLRIAERHRLPLIEDAAHGLGATWGGRPLGTIGDFGCFSFHGTKDVVCGEGGALTCRSERDRLRSEILRDKGTNRAGMLRGEVDKYTWVDEGGSYAGSDVLAAILLAQLQRLPFIVARKRALARTLNTLLQPLADVVRLPAEWPGIESSWHVYPVLVPHELRDLILRALRAEGIGATFHYVPLHSSPFSRDRFGYRPADLPTTEWVSASLVRLPLFAGMTDEDLEDVATATLKVISHFAPRFPSSWHPTGMGVGG